MADEKKTNEELVDEQVDKVSGGFAHFSHTCARCGADLKAGEIEICEKCKAEVAPWGSVIV